MKANEIVAAIARALMPPEEERTCGRNSSLLSADLEPILAPYRKERMKDFLTACATGPRTSFQTDSASGIMSRLCAEKQEAFKRISERRYAVYLYAHDEDAHDEPTLFVDLKDDAGRTAPEILYGGESYVLCVDEAVFETLMDNILLFPERIMAEVIRDHFKECLPADLQDCFLSAELTSGCVNSCWGDGSYTFGVEVRLRYNEKLHLVFAFTLEGCRSVYSIMDDVSYTMSILRKMETRARGMIPLASCQRGDLGVALTAPLVSGRSAVSDQLHYDVKKYASANSRKWFVGRNENHIRVYLTGMPEYERTTFICIAPACPPRLWTRILSDRDGWGDFFSVWNNRIDESMALVEISTK